jgi:multiple sugar transport system substrate-binding protein
MIRLLLTLVIGALALSGPACAQTVTLDVSWSVASYRPLMEETARLFEQREPEVRIRLRPPVATHEEHLQQTLRAALTGDLADVGFHGNHLVSVLAAREIAAPIDGFIARERDWAELGYAASAPEIARFGGHTYGLPWQISTPVLFYNATRVRAAGGDPDHLPRTWDAIIDLAKRMHAADPAAIGGHFDYLTNGNWTFQALITSQGGRMMTEGDRAIAFAGAEGLQALTIIAQFADAGMVDMTQGQVQQAFAAGSIGVLASYSALLGDFERAAAGHFTLRTGPWPLPTASGRLPAGGRTVVIQTRDPARAEAAWRYVRFMTGPVVQAMLVRQFGAEPANLLAVARPDLLGDYYREHPNARIGLDTLPALTSWYAFPGDNTVKIVDSIRDHLRDAATRRRTPAQALAEMVQAVEPLLPQH